MSKVRIGIGFGGRLGVPSAEEIGAFAERAEDLGIDSIWLSDRITSSQPQLDIALVMATFAARTKRIKMGPAVLTLPARDPIQVARAYASLDYLSGGRRRVIMAVGLGADPRDCIVCGIPPAERGARMEEGVAVLRKLWTETKVSHHGRFYNFDNVTVEPRPAGGALDVWIGGRSDIALRRVAKYGDGWFPSFISPAEFRDGMHKLQEYGAARGRQIDPDEAGVLLLTHVTEDRDQARSILQLAGASFQFNAEQMAERAAIGPAEECVERVRKFVEAGCTKFVLFPVCPPDQLTGQITAYAKSIIPHC